MTRSIGLWCVVALALMGGIVHSEETLKIVPIVSDGEVLVSFELADAYTDEVREAISSGLRTTFTYDIDLRMSVAGWVDRTMATAVVTTSSQYDNLTRRHTLSRAVDGRVVEVVVAEDDDVVRQWLTSVKRLPLYDASRLDATRDYFVRISARRRPSGSSLFGWAASITGQARFTFVP